MAWRRLRRDRGRQLRRMLSPMQKAEVSTRGLGFFIEQILQILGQTLLICPACGR